MHEQGLPSVLKLQEMPVPQIKPHEVLLKVGACGVSYHDVDRDRARHGSHGDCDYPLGRKAREPVRDRRSSRGGGARWSGFLGRRIEAMRRTKLGL